LTLTKRIWNNQILIQPCELSSSHTPIPPTSLRVMHIQLYELTPKYDLYELFPHTIITYRSGSVDPDSTTLIQPYGLSSSYTSAPPNFVGGYAHSTLRVDSEIRSFMSSSTYDLHSLARFSFNTHNLRTSLRFITPNSMG